MARSSGGVVLWTAAHAACTAVFTRKGSHNSSIGSERGEITRRATMPTPRQTAATPAMLQFLLISNAPRVSEKLPTPEPVNNKLRLLVQKNRVSLLHFYCIASQVVDYQLTA